MHEEREWTVDLSHMRNKLVCLEFLCQPGPLAQSAERRADNAKVVSSRLTWTTFFGCSHVFFFHTKTVPTDFFYTKTEVFAPTDFFSH